MERIGFIGMGNMGYAMLKGALTIFDKEQFVFSNRTKEKREKIAEELKVEAVDRNSEVVKKAKYVILAVKPQFFDTIIEEIKEVVTKEHIIISLAPGISIDSLKEKFQKPVRILRTMPNTPAMVMEGMTAGCYSDDDYTKEEQGEIEAFFKSFGEFEIVEERLIGAVICASGSSPAYVYMFIEALADSAVRVGLPRENAYRFAAQAVLGSAKMVLETGEHPGKLKDDVCSPGGTTIAGVAALEEFGLRNAVLKANEACFQKAESIK